ncbi:MAG TPA: GNAT family N-acetyltransferase [Anaerolineales bacterium]|nr:GNAT family N-acetyltransferase [Anaerolineales bacterium]
MTKVLETNRLLLRHLTLDDVNDVYALSCEGEVTRYLSDAPKGHNEIKDELEWIIKEYYGRYGFGLWAAILKSTSSFIGCCGLIPRRIDEHEEVEVACALRREYWRKGLGTEAAQAVVEYGLEHLHFSRLICMAASENHASIGLARKIGMILEKEVEVDGKRVLLFSATRLSDSQR